MGGLQGEFEALYSPGEVALQLNIQRQTVTKYARIFETEGFVFHKDEKGNRAYTDTNISMFRRVTNAKSKPGITLETAIKGVIPIYMKDSITPGVTEISTENEQYKSITNEKLDMLMHALAEQQKLILDQSQKIDSLQKQLNEHRLDVKNRDTKLLEHIREHQKERKAEMLLIAQSEVAAAREEQQEKGFFARLFGK
ncbi:MerR family transcriptional regulator [Priestia sp. LL-8]|uniref:MerR family transcriptional regulator n=1 Tax=Priestia sp. LL-8 TaxID=3110068 RepID=UPI002E275D2B|nr:MerR family transcriptional regulator [Priestia sp. LL-8]